MGQIVYYAFVYDGKPTVGPFEIEHVIVKKDGISLGIVSDMRPEVANVTDEEWWKPWVDDNRKRFLVITSAPDGVRFQVCPKVVGPFNHAIGRASKHYAAIRNGFDGLKGESGKK